MKKVLHSIILLSFCLLAIQVNAKTVYYVKSGATGNGTSWSNASGSIQAMIDEASPGDEVWIAGGTYVTPSLDNYNYWFKLKLGVSIFGGFKGGESDLMQREKKDRNRNGKVEPWEFANETILSGNFTGEKRQWKIDDENNILEIISDVEKCSYEILRYYPDEVVTSYPSETYVSGFTITEGKSACRIYSSDCFVISDCEICYNDDYQYVLWLNKSGESDYQSCIKNSTIHHNLANAACYGNSIENCVIHHNHGQGNMINDFKSINECDIYANVNGNYDYTIKVNTCSNSKIHENECHCYPCITCDTMYNSEVYKNKGEGGASVSTAYDCKFYQNIGQGVSVSGELSNCEIYQNEYYGIYASNSDIRNCKIYQNKESGVRGGILYNCEIYNNPIYGITESTAYNCHIYGNEERGANSSNLYDCIIENNTGGGGTSGGSLYNCIIRNNFTVGNGGGCSGGHLENCKIYNNESLFDGGGVSYGSVRGCSIFNNKAGGNGGGASNGEYYNCDIYNNSAVSYGGVSLGSYTNCTIVNNETFFENDNTGFLKNSILVGTFEGSASYSAFTDSYIQGSGNFLATEKELKIVKSTSFIGNASNEKQLEELNNADFSLSKGSIAIDMGYSGYLVPVNDKSGYPRPMGEKTDIGSHEYFSLKTLSYENKFDENSFSMNYWGKWSNDKLPGKGDYFLYYDGEVSTTIYNAGLNYVTTTFFDKTVSNKINLSFDVVAKYKTKDQQEKLHIVLAYLDSNKQDTIMTFSNTDYLQDLHFSQEISSWVKNKVFRVLFAVEDPNSLDYYNRSSIVYCGIANLKISKQDASVEVISEDKVYAYDAKSHAIDYQINDTRVDKKKVVVTYQKEGETTSTTTPPVKAGIYQVQISIEDGAYFGMKEVKLTIEKANQTIQWAQQLRTMKAKEKIQLEASASSGLPISFSSEDETRAKVESINGKWWLVADTVPGEVSIKASQLGNENYNLANSVLKTIRIESVPTGILSVATNKATAYFVKAENCISVKNINPNSQLYLYDSLGHLCIMKDTDNTEMQIPVHELSKGIYYLLIVDRNEKENFKILIN